MIEPENIKKTKKEKRLARALLLSATMHLLRQERKSAVDMGNYEYAKDLDRRIMKRDAKIWEVLEDYWYVR